MQFVPAGGAGVLIVVALYLFAATVFVSASEVRCTRIRWQLAEALICFPLSQSGGNRDNNTRDGRRI